MGALRRVGLVFGALVVGFAVGPRATIELEGGPAPVPTDLRAAAEAFEAADRTHPDVTPGAEPKVTWGGAPGAVTDWSVLYLHGFSATRQETAPLAETVARALRATLVEPRLTGHGRPGEALGRATVADWMTDGRQALALARAAGRRTVLIACSTGATLATAIALTDQPDGVTYAFLSPNYQVKNQSAQLLLLPWARTWVPWVVGAERSWTPKNERHGRFWSRRYPTSALFPMMGLVHAVQNADLTRMQGRLLIFAHPDDPTVDTATTEALLAQMTSAEVARGTVPGPGDRHVIAGDILAPARTATMAAEILDFLRAAE